MRVQIKLGEIKNQHSFAEPIGRQMQPFSTRGCCWEMSEWHASVLFRSDNKQVFHHMLAAAGRSSNCIISFALR